MRFLIAGDLVITEEFDFNKMVSDEIITLFQNSNCNIINLEAPVTDSNQKILKTGPHLKSHKKSTLDALKTLKINLVTLANNHVKDYDDKGVIDTLDFCRNNNIDVVGAGKNINEASNIFFLDTVEGRIAIINIAENEWSSASHDKPGANGMSIIGEYQLIKEAKVNSDFVFLIVHGGHEYYQLPSPRMQNLYRFYADVGADLIVGHHTHCISGYEEYKGIPIYYSLGNFLFTKESRFDSWYQGMVLEVKIVDKKIKTQKHFIKSDKNDYSLALSNDGYLKEKIESLNSIIEDEEKLLKEWNKFVKEKSKHYLRRWSPISFIGNKYISYFLSKVLGTIISKRGIALYLNLMRCESHHDLSKEIITEYLNKTHN